MIGDNLATDVLGARRRGFDSLLVLEGGVHGALDAAALAARGRARRAELRFPHTSAGEYPTMTDDRPNVLFICADQWRADCIGALGHPHVRTPEPRRADRRRRPVREPLRPVHALRAVAHQPPDRALPDEPPLGPQRHAARRPLHQRRARGAQARLRPDALRLYRHLARPARQGPARPGGAGLRRGRHAGLHARGAHVRGDGALDRRPDRQGLRPARRPRRRLPAARRASRSPTTAATATSPRSSPPRTATRPS